MQVDSNGSALRSPSVSTPALVKKLGLADALAMSLAIIGQSMAMAFNVSLAASEEARGWFGGDFFAVYLQFKRSEIKALQGLDPAEVCKRYVEAY